jgi:hydroxypyruvate reductase
VRKHCELLKGGRLTAWCGAGQIRALVLSDVIGDPLDVISSGPFVPDPTTFADALGVLDRHAASPEAPRVREFLLRGARGEFPETPKPGDPTMNRVRSEIVGSNSLVVDAVRASLIGVGAEPVRVLRALAGEVSEVAARLAQEAREISRTRLPGSSAALVVGGEWTVNAAGSKGVGGPSQELALALACRLSLERKWAAMAYSTDGIDGPTDAAGAIVTEATLADASAIGLDARAALTEHDSHGYFMELDGRGAEHLRTGPTGTNLNHIAVLVLS